MNVCPLPRFGAGPVVLSSPLLSCPLPQPSAMDVCYCSDKRYPGPKVFELPPHIDGVPTQAELDAQPRLVREGRHADSSLHGAS